MKLKSIIHLVLVRIYLLLFFCFFIVATKCITVDISGSGKIVFQSRRYKSTYEIVTMNIDGSDIKRVTYNEKDDWYPNFSSDGSKIVFARGELWSSNLEIFVMNADGSNEKQLTNNGYDDLFPTFSPDGSKILFIRDHDTAPEKSNVDWEIYIMNADGSNQKRLTNNSYNEHYPAFSPDGSRIVFRRELNAGNNLSHEIFIMNVDGTAEKRLTYNSLEDECPSFSPDGKTIVFQYGDYFNEPDLIICTMDINGKNKKQLTSVNETDNDQGASFSPDGNKIVFFRDWEIYIMNVDGTNVKRLTNHDERDMLPCFSGKPR